MDKEDERDRKVGGAIFVRIGVAGIGLTAYEIMRSAFVQDTPIQFYRFGLQFQDGKQQLCSPHCFSFACFSL